MVSGWIKLTNFRYRYKSESTWPILKSNLIQIRCFLYLFVNYTFFGYLCIAKNIILVIVMKRYNTHLNLLIYRYIYFLYISRVFDGFWLLDEHGTNCTIWYVPCSTGMSSVDNIIERSHFNANSKIPLNFCLEKDENVKSWEWNYV